MIRYMLGFFRPRKPIRGGVEFSGEVVEVGKSVKRYKPGDFIFGMAMNAGSHAPKTYLVKVSGKPDEKAINRLRAGIMIQLEDGTRVKTSPAKVRLVKDAPNPWYEVILIEGRNRQIRRMFQNVGFLVEKIKRVQMGPLVLDVPLGKFRALTEREVAKLKSL